jgi:hypothetical protein
MFLTRVGVEDDCGITRLSPKYHIAESMNSTMCSRYTPSNKVEGNDLFMLLGEHTLKNYLEDILINKRKDHDICTHCIKSLKNIYGSIICANIVNR